MPKAVLFPTKIEICCDTVKFYFYFTLGWLPNLHAIRIMNDRQGKILKKNPKEKCVFRRGETNES